MDTYKTMAEYWIKAIQEAASKLDEGKIFGQITVQEWAKKYDTTFAGSFFKCIRAVDML